MRKIRKFKVAIHLKEILRRVRLSGIDTVAAGYASDNDIAVLIAELHKEIQPGVVYEFIEGPCLELSTAGIKHGEQFSVCIITLGADVQQKMAQFTEGNTLAIANIIVYEFLRTALSFTADLIKEDAQKEDFITEGYEVLSAPSFGYGPEPKFLREARRLEPALAQKALPILFERLNAQKIGVSFEDGQVSPKTTIAFIMPWYKKKKK